MNAIWNFIVAVTGMAAVVMNISDDAGITKDDIDKDVDAFIEYYTQSIDSIKNIPKPEYITQKKLMEDYRRHKENVSEN